MSLKIGDKFIWLREDIEYTVVDIDESRVWDQVLLEWVHGDDLFECGWYHVVSSLNKLLDSGEIIIVNRDMFVPVKRINKLCF